MDGTWKAGDRLFVRYGHYRRWHERLLLFRRDGARWIVVTPDFNVNEVLLQVGLRDAPSGEISELRFQGTWAGVAAGVEAAGAGW